MNKLVSILAPFFFLVFVSCEHKNNLPKGVLDENQMVNIIVEVELKQAMYKLKFANKDSISYNQLITQTFKQQKTTKEQFNNSLAYYAEHPVLLKEFYDKALIVLTERQAENQLNTSRK